MRIMAWWMVLIATSIKTVAALVLAALLSSSGAMAAGRVFFDGFEDGTTNAWSNGGGTGWIGKCDVVTSALDGGIGPRNGTRMARCNWDGTQGEPDGHSYQAMNKTGWAKTRESFMRFWVRVDSDVDNKQGSKLFRAPGAISYDAIQFEYGTGASFFSTIYKSNNQQIGTTNWGCGGGFRSGTWKKFELYFLESTSGQNNGVARIWVDDVLCWEALNQNTDDPQGAGYWADFHLMSNWSLDSGGAADWTHDANNHIYWDDFEIYSDAASGATGLMSDGSISVGGGGSPADLDGDGASSAAASGDARIRLPAPAVLERRPR